MTRINVVPPEELCNKHLFAEWRELPRIYTAVNKKDGIVDFTKIPSKYVLGTGHVLFFYDKIKYLEKRYFDLTIELTKRGYNLSFFREFEFTFPLERFAKIYNDYTPTQEAIELNRARIKDRMPSNPKWRI